MYSYWVIMFTPVPELDTYANAVAFERMQF
jgi:hypothetical protein